jgi:hypothetical protein
MTLEAVPLSATVLNFILSIIPTWGPCMSLNVGSRNVTLDFDQCTIFIDGCFASLSCSHAKECGSYVKSCLSFVFVVLNSEPWK